MRLSVKEISYLLGNTDNGWEKYRIKDKLRDVNYVLSIVSESDKIHEFTQELLPIVKVAMKIAFIIDANAFIDALKKEEEI